MDLDLLIDKEFSGAISVRRNGDIVFQKAYGFADISNKVLNKLDTKFQTASAGKAFVAVAILQLIDFRMFIPVNPRLESPEKKIELNLATLQPLTMNFANS